MASDMSDLTEDYSPLWDIVCPGCAKELPQKTTRCPQCSFEHPTTEFIPSIEEFSSLPPEHTVNDVSPAFINAVISKAMHAGWLEEIAPPPVVNEE